ncbi:hypothetical protein ABPG72_009779 [Tetrahymena utriculariae]
MSTQTFQKLQKSNPLQSMKKCGLVQEEKDNTFQKNFFSLKKQSNQCKEQQCLKDRLKVCTGELKDEIEKFDDLCSTGMISSAYCEQCEKILEYYQK